MRLRFFLLLFGATLSTAGADTSAYKLDFSTPAPLVFSFPDGPPLPSRVEVYRTGPTVGTDNRETPDSLSRRVPAYSVTNPSEVKELIAALQQTVSFEKVSNVPTHEGYTYHLLLFNDERKTVMHFRVLEFTDITTSWADVWPRSDTNFVYFNNKVIPWLKAHAKFNPEEPGASPKAPNPAPSAPAK